MLKARFCLALAYAWCILQYGNGNTLVTTEEPPPTEEPATTEQALSTSHPYFIDTKGIIP